MTAIPFSNFSKGEIAPELQARLDTSQYEAAAKKVKNFIIQRYGGLSFRQGFRFVAEVDNVAHSIKYIPFQYNMEQAYIMVLQDANFRLLTKGGLVLEVDNLITAITKEATPLVTAANHGYIVGQKVFLSGIVGMTQLNGRSALVTAVVDANNFRIGINTTTYGTFVSSSGTAAGTPPVVPPAGTVPPVPPALPPVPPVTDGGGTGGDLGVLPGRERPDGLVSYL